MHTVKGSRSTVELRTEQRQQNQRLNEAEGDTDRVMQHRPQLAPITIELSRILLLCNAYGSPSELRQIRRLGCIIVWKHGRSMWLCEGHGNRR